MKAFIAMLSIALLPLATHAQFVKGNEAVRTVANEAAVEVAPTPAAAGKPCAADAKCHAGAWRMVETPTGLMECTEPWARAGTCRASTYGAQKLPRVWVVKRNNEWAQCQYPDLASKCTPVFARPPANLPFDAVQ